MIRLSIIIPIYNVEKYLTKCLNSLLTQDISMNEFEIILVDDGSSDKSTEISQFYTRNYSNVSFYYQEHVGVGGARNFGGRMAKGKYFFFVDSDDYIQTNSLGTILSYAEENDLDLVRFNFEFVNEDGTIIKKKRNAVYRTIYNEKIVNGITFISEYLGWACYSWQFFIKASFLRENSLTFNETIFYEDIEWIIRVLPLAKRVQSFNRCIYYYLQHSGSITQSIHTEKINKVITDKIFVVTELQQLANRTESKMLHSWCNGMISLIFIGILGYVVSEMPERKMEIIGLLYKQKFLPLKTHHFTFKQWVNIFIINVSPTLFCYLKNKK